MGGTAGISPSCAGMLLLKCTWIILFLFYYIYFTSRDIANASRSLLSMVGVALAYAMPFMLNCLPRPFQKSLISTPQP